MEKNIENYLKKQIESRGGLCIKLVSPGFVGIMDRMVLLPGGQIYFIELKSTGKKLRPRQDYVKRQFEALGFICFKIGSEEQVNLLINKIF